MSRCLERCEQRCAAGKTAGLRPPSGRLGNAGAERRVLGHLQNLNLGAGAHRQSYELHTQEYKEQVWAFHKEGQLLRAQPPLGVGNAGKECRGKC